MKPGVDLIRKIKRHLKQLLGIKSTNKKKPEVVIASFPKCGRTWLRLLIAKYIQLHFKFEDTVNLIRIQDFNEINNKVPSIKFVHDDNPFFKRPDKLEINKWKYVNQSVIFLFRDPRDVLISSYYHKQNREPRKRQFKGTLSAYINETKGGLLTIIEYYNIWYKWIAKLEKIIPVSYEDLSRDTFGTLTIILNFILPNENIEESLVHEAVSFCSIEKMKEMEKLNAFNSNKLKPERIDDEVTYKVRKGKVGGFKEELNVEQIQHINTVIETHLNRYYIERYGY